MKGDFTRDTFDVARHFSRVLMQQGRVQLDADFNEQAAILLHFIRTLAADLIGPSGGPEGENFGFSISFAAGGNGNFRIGKGRYYVDGILCENDTDGLKYRDQDGFEDAVLPDKDSPYYVYLDVWERHITYVQHDHIREVALYGPDTCTRAQVVWQVKFSPPSDATELTCKGAGEWVDKHLTKLSDVAMSARVRLEGAYKDPCSLPPESRYRGLENHLYRIEVHRGGVAWGGQVDDQGLPIGNANSAATFKYSRDNGSVVFPIVRQEGNVVTLQSLGRDQRLSLHEGVWVEIIDDVKELRGESGVLAQVDTIKPEEMTVTLKWPSDAPQPPNWTEYDEYSSNHPLLRRWDQGGIEGRPMWQGAILITESMDNWIEIEDGIEIQFQLPEAGNNARIYRTGDYWLIPARVATGKIEWPVETDKKGNESPRAIQPQGIEHRYAPLAVIENLSVVHDCRLPISPVAK